MDSESRWRLISRFAECLDCTMHFAGEKAFREARKHYRSTGHLIRCEYQKEKFFAPEKIDVSKPK